MGFGALPHSRLRSGRLVITVAGNTLIVHIVTTIMARTPGVAGVIAVDSYARIVRIRSVVYVDARAAVPPPIPIGVSVIRVSVVAVVIDMQAVG